MGFNVDPFPVAFLGIEVSTRSLSGERRSPIVIFLCPCVHECLRRHPDCAVFRGRNHGIRADQYEIVFSSVAGKVRRPLRRAYLEERLQIGWLLPALIGSKEQCDRAFKSIYLTLFPNTFRNSHTSIPLSRMIPPKALRPEKSTVREGGKQTFPPPIIDKIDLFRNADCTEHANKFFFAQ